MRHQASPDPPACRHQQIFRQPVQTMTPEECLMIRGASQGATTTAAAATERRWYKLERDGSEQLDDKIGRPIIAAAEATRTARSTPRTEQDHHHHNKTGRMLEMSSRAKHELLVRVKRPSPSAKFSYAPAEIIKCQIETTRRQRRRIRRGAPPLVRLAALSVLISLIQCITLIACSAHNSQQRPTRTTTGKFCIMSESVEQRVRRAFSWVDS